MGFEYHQMKNKVNYKKKIKKKKRKSTYSVKKKARKVLREWERLQASERDGDDDGEDAVFRSFDL